MKILRWILMLPSAIVCGWLAYFLAGIINRWGYLRETGQPASPFVAALLDVGGHMLMGAAATYVAARIAPDHKKIVSASMTGLVLLLSGAFIFSSILARNYMALLMSIGFIVGSLGVTISVFRDEIEL
jgi:hypothetical protein